MLHLNLRGVELTIYISTGESGRAPLCHGSLTVHHEQEILYLCLKVTERVGNSKEVEKRMIVCVGGLDRFEYAWFLISKSERDV